MDGWTNGRMDGWIDGWVDGWMDEGLMDRQMDGQTGRRTDGWTTTCTFKAATLLILITCENCTCGIEQTLK